MMNFWKTIQNSIYSPKFYSIVLTKSFKNSLGYFLLLALILTVINLLTLIQPLFIEVPATVQNFAQSVINCYPKDLEIKITNGQVSINAEEPYFLKSCEGQNLGVIDTKISFSTSKFDEYKVPAWVTKDSIVYKKSNVETSTYSLSRMKDFTLNQQVINSYYKMFSPYLKFVGPILLLLSFIGIFLIFDFRLIYLLLLASIIWLLGKIFKQTLGYGQAYKVGLHAITLGLIVELIVGLTNRWTHLYGFPFMVSILTLGVITVNLFLPKRGSES